MCEEDTQMKELLQAGAMSVEPEMVRMQAVRRNIAAIASSRRVTRRRPRTVLLGTLGLITVSAAGFAATQTGRDLIGRLFTPVEPTHAITGEHSDGSGMWFVSRSGPGAEPFTAQEEADTRARLAEMERIAAEGGGHLTGLIEGTLLDGTGYFVTYLIEYALSDGRTERVGSSPLRGKQAANMRIDEILALRDSGGGELISQQDFPIGLGRYTIRFTLSDGHTVDLQTWYPPGTRAEREAIFEETRMLRQQRQFDVSQASREPDGSVHGVVRYTLADGRTVGLSQTIPPELVSQDGTQVVSPGAAPTDGGEGEAVPNE